MAILVFFRIVFNVQNSLDFLIIKMQYNCQNFLCLCWQSFNLTNFFLFLLNLEHSKSLLLVMKQ